MTHHFENPPSQAVFLELDDVSLAVTTSLNPGTLLLVSDDINVEHECVLTIE